MQYSANLHLNLPEDSDPLEVSKLSENFEKLDKEVGDISGGGDTSVIVRGMKVGDITYSSRNLEEETGGVLVACDQREVLISAYSELCAMPFMKNRYRADFREYPVPYTESAGIKTGVPGLNARIGERYIPSSTVTDANWNSSVHIYDLEQQKKIGSVSTTIAHTFINDECVMYIYGTTLYRTLLSKLSAKREIASLSTIQFIMAWQDVYLFVIPGAAADAKKLKVVFVPRSTILEDVTTKINAQEVSFTPATGYKLFYIANFDALYSALKSAEIPFVGHIKQYKDKLYMAQTVQNVTDTTDIQMGIFSSSDGIFWNQVYQLPIPSTQATTRWALGVVGDELYVYMHTNWQHAVDGVTLYDAKMTIAVLNENMEQLHKYEIDNAYVNSASIYIEDGYLYAQLRYTTDKTVNFSETESLKVNLETGERSVLSLPSWVYKSGTTSAFGAVMPTLLWGEVATSVGSTVGYRFIERYDFEKGRIAAATTPTRSRISEPAEPLYQPLQDCAYNSTYFFLRTTDLNSNFLVYPRNPDTRVLPYIPNAYIKALNEPTEEASE